MKTKIIGLTGGIGSGKTTMAAYFKSLGVPVYIADDEAKKILYLPETAHKVMEKFGPDAFTNGIPDRKKLGAIVFKDPEKLKELNGIIHPLVQQHFNGWVAQHSHNAFVIKEAAILFESGSYKDCDKIILVTAPQEARVERVMKRDAVSQEEVLQRMSHQWSEEEKKLKSDFIIENNEINYAKKQAQEIFINLNKAYN